MNKKGIGVIDLICAVMITAVGTSFAWKTAYEKSYAKTDYVYNNEDFEKLKKVKAIVDNVYLNEVDEEKAVEGAINGMLESLEDPYTVYFDKTSAEQFLVETEGEYEGVGLYVSYDTSKNMVIVISPIEGSPAAKAGILPGDYIKAVDGVDATNSTLDGVTSNLKGPAGTKVDVTIVRYDKEGKSTTLEKTLNREKVVIDPVVDKIYENNIGYIKLSSFDETSYYNFYSAYNKLINKEKVSGLIIDLRNNPGGLLDVATKIADLLVPKGKIVYTLDKLGRQETIYSDARQIEIPLVIIINEGSASASEVLSGAVKDYGVGKIVGVNSYGKGVVQTLISLQDGTYLKVTTSEYFSPNGNKINGVGIKPDVEVELPEEITSYYNLKFEDDTQLQTAINELKKMM